MIGISPHVLNDMTIVEIEAAICGNAEKDKEQYEFIQRIIWESVREATFEIVRNDYKPKLKRSTQIWKFPWDKKHQIDDKIKERLAKADKIFPKYIKQ